MTALTREAILTAELSAAEARLWRIADALKRRRLPSSEDCLAHARALEAILSREDPGKALELPKRKGRPRRNAGEIDRIEVGPVIAVEAARAAGKTLEEALAQVAQTDHLSVETLRRYHKRQRKVACHFLAAAAAGALKARKGGQ